MAISKNQIKFIRQLEQKKFRRREGLFVAEGTKVVGDLLAHYTPHAVFATDEWLKDHASENCHLSSVITEVTDEELRRLSFLQHPQQVLALFPIPGSPLGTPPFGGGWEGLALALDGIQDPGNLGTIIRIADWFGIEQIFCSDDTVDAWNPKVVQATMGSIARVNIIYINLSEFLDTLPADFPVYGTLLDGDNIYKTELPQGGAFVIFGNEGQGISPKIAEHVTKRLHIPAMPRKGARSESLNVGIAAAITISELRRQLLK